MNKTIVAKISEGLGNQFFMYANAYAISKNFNFNFNIDPYSGYYKNDLRTFMLDNFNISSQIASPKWIFSGNLRHNLKKILIKLEKLNSKKSFLFEHKNQDKSTKYQPFDMTNIKNTIYIDGNFESEKYFFKYKNDLSYEFSFKNLRNFTNNKYLDIINKYNVVSISLRQNRFSERNNNITNNDSIVKSELFVKDTIDYINRSIDFIKTKVTNPRFLLWSNDFKNLEEYFPSNEFYHVNNLENKILNDFYLLTQCRYFIIGPSTFSWWGAWLSNKENKICIRPKNLNPSNNIDFWPESWISI